MNLSKKENLSLLTDFYEFTMSNGYFVNAMSDRIAYFDVFFRNIPDNGGFVVMCGLEQAIDFIKQLHFSEDDISFLRDKHIFDEKFLNYLANFNFNCDVWAFEEGVPVFPGEPIITVRGPIIQAQLIETFLLLCINHQSLIATKANRMVRAAKGRSIMEFGARRAQGHSAAIFGSRAAYIAGCSGTSCTISDKLMSIPALGTMAHSWVQMFDSEEKAFRAYADLYPSNCIFLVDTYNALKSGIPNAIKIFKEQIIPRGYRPGGIRFDSGDITYLSQQARKMLDEAGLRDCKIYASNALDEYLIREMIAQGAEVDSFGIGERLITSATSPILGGVYKLVAIEDNGRIIPKIKISENVAKLTTPGFKDVFRLYDAKDNKALADIVTLFDEKINDNESYEIFDPKFTWKKKTIDNFKAVKIRKQIFKNGKLCYNPPDLPEIRKRLQKELDTLWQEVKRFENPHKYYIDLSKKLWEQKQELLKTY